MIFKYLSSILVLGRKYGRTIFHQVQELLVLIHSIAMMMTYCTYMSSAGSQILDLIMSCIVTTPILDNGPGMRIKV